MQLNLNVIVKVSGEKTKVLYCGTDTTEAETAFRGKKAPEDRILWIRKPSIWDQRKPDPPAPAKSEPDPEPDPEPDGSPPPPPVRSS